MPEELNSQPATEPEGGAPDGAATPPAAAPAPNGQEPQGGQQEAQPNQEPQQDGQEPKQGNPDNAEAAKWRVKLREQEKANADLQAAIDAAKAEQSDMVQKIGKVFGFVNDEDAEQADAQKIVEQITTERDTLQDELKQLRQANALNTAIGGYQVDGKQVPLDTSLTLAVVRGTGALNDLDPASDDYPAQVARVVSETVEAHPQLKTQVVPKSSGNAPTPTENASGKLTRDQVAALAAEGKWDEINEAAAAGRIA